MRTLLLPLPLLLLLLVFIEDQKVIQFFMRISLLWMRRDSEMTSQCFTHVKGSQQQGEGRGGRGRNRGEVVRNECACSWLVGDVVGAALRRLVG